MYNIRRGKDVTGLQYEVCGVLARLDGTLSIMPQIDSYCRFPLKIEFPHNISTKCTVLCELLTSVQYVGEQ